MKRLFALLLCVVMIVALVACDNTKEENNEAEYKLGMGIVVGTDSSKTGNAQVDATVATVVTDADGKIVLCRIDVAQNKFALATDFANTEKVFETKKELKERYNMAAYGKPNVGDTVLEWYKQAEVFENFVVGKTVAELETLKNNTQLVNNHNISTNEDLLNAGCTIEIGDFCEAAIKACKDEQGMSFKAVAGTFTLGVAAKTALDSATKAATAEANGTVAMYSDFACAVVADGKVIATLNDAIQPKITVDVEGNIVGSEFKGTKRELKEGYNMAAYGSDNDGDERVLEWYVQSAEFSKFVVGKTATEIADMKTQFVNNHYISVDETLLAAGYTMQITGICAVVAQAANYAK